MDHLLLVDDEQDYCNGLKRLLQRELPTLTICACDSAAQALDAATRQTFAVALLDVKMPEMNGIELLTRLRGRDPDLTVIMMTAYGTVDMAVQAMKDGAWDFITKPIDTAALLKTVHQGLERNRLLRENLALKQQLEDDGQHGFIGQSTALATFVARLRQAAATDYTVLIRGPSGTGKELAGRAIHRLSERRNGPLVLVNCPAIPEHLLESELFGHQRGAFTGADRDHRGLFAQADGGTICLDEIGDIPMAVQTKLLRVIESREIKPLGAATTQTLNVRVVAMTNQDLEQKIRDHHFREDLFYRLNVLPLETPALANMAEDIPLLAAHFLDQAAREQKRPLVTLSPEAAQELSRHPWPGNVRQLKNAMRRLLLCCQDETVSRDHIRALLTDRRPPPAGEYCLAGQPYAVAKEAALTKFAGAYFGNLLRQYDGNISQVARQAHMTRSALQKVLKRFAINASCYRSTPQSNTE